VKSIRFVQSKGKKPKESKGKSQERARVKAKRLPRWNVKKAVRLEGELLGEMMTMPKKVLDATGVISRPFGRQAPCGIIVCIAGFLVGVCMAWHGMAWRPRPCACAPLVLVLHHTPCRENGCSCV